MSEMLESKVEGTDVEWAASVSESLENMAAALPERFTLPEHLSLGDTVKVIEELVRIHRATSTIHRRTGYAIGQAIIQAEERFGEKYAQALDATDLSYGTLRNYVYMARNVPPENTSFEVSESVLLAVAPVKNKGEQKAWIERAAEEKWSGEKTRYEIKEGGKRDHEQMTGANAEYTPYPEGGGAPAGEDGPREEPELERHECRHCGGKGFYMVISHG